MAALDVSRPAKKAKLLSDSEDSDEEEPQLNVNGGKLQQNNLKINEEFAKRFEHNKKREEQHRLEEKYERNASSKKRKADAVDEDEEEESSTDESEDDEADLITDELDNEIMSTLQAIKAKDPRVYDKEVKFYREIDEDATAAGPEKKTEKPMTLRDYHRENLMAGYTGAEDDVEVPPKTYNEEQDALRREVIGQMHNATGAEDAEDQSDDDDFKPKPKGKHEELPSTRSRPLNEADVAAADKDPETFLSNFMASQAWRPTGAARHPTFDSDDSDEDARADAFEEAYNMRFEDPALANERLQSFARDAGKYSVRRDTTGGRKKAREREREKKEDDKRGREEDKARLRKLKIDEAGEKLKKIKHAAGLRGKDVDVEDWKDVIEGDFDDDAWDREMTTRFGERYYAEGEHNLGSDEEATGQDTGKKRRPTKPRWDDDIDIKDLIPDFEENEAEAHFTLSADEDEGDGAVSASEDVPTTSTSKKGKSKKDREQEKRETKRKSRLERRAIEDMVDAALPVSAAPKQSGFRYRATSPTSFGLDARDILLASDAQLNQFAGLKKLAAFRDQGRKEKDKKKLGKKARLREWRKEVFGSADGPPSDFGIPKGVSNEKSVGEKKFHDEQDGAASEKKRQRRKKKKSKVSS